MSRVLVPGNCVEMSIAATFVIRSNGGRRVLESPSTREVNWYILHYKRITEVFK